MRSAYVIRAGTHTFSRDGVIGGAELNTAVSISAPAQKFCSQLIHIRGGEEKKLTFSGKLILRKIGFD